MRNLYIILKNQFYINIQFKPIPMILNNIKDQKTIRYLVPENVRKEIEDNHYYK